MKQVLLMIALVALVGCGGGTLDLTAQPELEKAIREHLKETRGVMPTGKLTKADLEKVTALALGGNQLTELPKGLEKLTQLTTLGLYDNKLTDVKGLEKLTQLTELVLQYNKLTSVKGLEKLTKLTELVLSENKLTSVKGLENLTQLQALYLDRNQLTDVKGLEKLMKLSLLHLEDNPDLTKAQIDQLQKALPKCDIRSNPTK